MQQSVEQSDNLFRNFYQESKPYTKIIINDHNETSFNIVSSVRNFNLHSNVKDLLLQLKPVANTLNSQGEENT